MFPQARRDDFDAKDFAESAISPLIAVDTVAVASSARTRRCRTRVSSMPISVSSSRMRRRRSALTMAEPNRRLLSFAAVSSSDDAVDSGGTEWVAVLGIER